MESGNSLVQQIMLTEPNRSVNELHYPHCDTLRFGEIKPIFKQHCLPGDKIKLDCAPFVRCEPMLAPIFGQIDVTVHYFFVPYRLIWDNWNEFITGGRLGISEPLAPYFAPPSSQISVNTNGRLFDSLSLARTKDDGNLVFPQKVSSLSWRAYWKIIDDYYRDQNLEPSFFDPEVGTPFISTSRDGQEDWSNINQNKFGMPFHRAWRKDMFTAALPWPQRGAQVDIPIGGDVEATFYDDGQPVQAEIQANNNDGDVTLTTNQAGLMYGKLNVSENAVSIEDLREANAVQRWLERNAVGGSRPNEVILSHFNVQVPDYRLQRPEFIAGVTTPVMISQVVQQSQTTDNSVLGDLGGHGISAGEMETAEYFCYEHGVILGLMSITPKAVYSQGVHRNDLKFDKFDYGWPVFENLGEQEVLNAEVYVQGSDDDFGTFGYNPRYVEYKMKDAEVHGDFRTNLDFWIPQRKFESMPALNADFVKINPANEGSLNNIFAVIDPNQDPFRVVVQNYSTTIRSLSKYSKFNF